MDNQSLWESVLTELQLALSSANFQTWFKGKTSVLEIKGGVVEIACQNAYSKVWLEERYLGKIKEVVDRLLGSPHSLVFTIKNQTPQEKPSSKEPKHGTAPLFEETASPAIKDGVEKANLNPRYKLTNFIVGQSNQLAYAVAKAIVDKPFDLYNPMLITGGVGVGKTHLLQAIGQALILRRSNTSILYTTSEAFTNEMIEAIQKKSTTGFRSKFRSADVLLIDDIQFIAGRESTQEEFFHTFNHLHSKGKQIIMTSDRPPQEISNLEERLKSRFSGGMVATIDDPEVDLREAFLLAKAAELSLTIDFSIVRFLAENIRSSIRDLEGALLRVRAVSLLTDKNPDLDLVKTVVGLGVKKSKTGAQIVESVADYFSVSVKELRSSKRNRELVFPRQIAMYTLRKELDLSFNQIASLFGGRDHTSAIYSVNKVEKLVEKEGEIKRLVADLRNKVFGG